MSDMKNYLNSGLYKAEDFQDKFVLEFRDERYTTVLKVYKTRRNLAKAIVRISARLGYQGVRARTFEGVRIVQLTPDETADTPGYQEAHVSEDFGYTTSAVWYHGRFAERVDAVPKDGKELSNKELTMIARDVGRKYGYEQVEAVFYAFDTYKIRWTRNTKWINLEISDYLRKAEPLAIREVLVLIFEKLKGSDPGFGVHAQRFFRSLREDTDLKATFIARNHLVLKDVAEVREAQAMAGVRGYTSAVFRTRKYDDNPRPVLSAILGIAAVPEGQPVDVEELARGMADGERRLFGA